MEANTTTKDVTNDSSTDENNDGTTASSNTPMQPPVTTGSTHTMNNETNNDGLFVSNAGCLLLPKIERIPWWTFSCLSFLVAIPTVLYLAAFTRLGFGLLIYSSISKHLEPWAGLVGGATALYLFVLYLTDVLPHATYIWSKSVPCIRYMQQLAVFVGCVGIAVVVVSLAGVYPYGPIALYIVVTPLWMLWVWKVFYANDISTRAFIGGLGGPFLVVSAVVFLVWILWTLHHGSPRWNHDEIYTVVAEAKASACTPNLIDFSSCESQYNSNYYSNIADSTATVCFFLDEESSSIIFPNECDESCATNVYEDCLNPFLLWVGPFLVSLCLLFLSFMATFLRHTTTSSHDNDSLPETQSTKGDMIRFAKLWMVLLFGMWVSASLAGAGAGLSTALAAMTLAGFVASALFVAVSFNAMERHEKVKGIWKTLQAQEKENGSTFDAAKGLLLLTCTPVAVLYLVIALFKQQVIRNCLCMNSRTDSWFTEEAQKLMRWVGSWQRPTAIFTAAVYWGVAFVVMNVIVAQFTLVFLSWLIEHTSSMPLAHVTAILMGVGMCMFLLPPVPGVPIYLTLGIVILPVGRESLGILGSITYAMVASTCLKLLACTVQQKVIGGLMQHRVCVRQFVGVNSKVIRSMKLILTEPGLGIEKVSILIGGPDWPTSVLCGIMDLSLIPILVGTLPIVFLILPTLLTGCFTYMQSLRVTNENGIEEEEFPWAGTVGTVCAAFTGLVQFGSMVVAGFYLEQTVSKRGDELETMPFDQEVEIADAKLEEARKAYKEVTQWDVVPTWAKWVLSASVTFMISSCYMLQSLQDLCFAEYQLTYTIDQHLGGDWTNIVRPLGLVAIGLFLTATVLLQIFISWAKRRASQKVAATAEGTPYESLGEL